MTEKNRNSWWTSVGKKIVETVISVKFLTLVALMWISCDMVYSGKLSGETWATLNGALITSVIALREGFKVAKVKMNGNGNDSKDMKI